mmetsp:Transcript_8677/g.10955  ORF Transcript_8677/g.10955 Transcript_8677/m.10955 type:complete len:144 (+) Transcript_8677:382-813(+)
MVKLKKSLGVALQKVNRTVNLAYMIDFLESQQRIADNLDSINKENNEEQARKKLCREATAACLKNIHEHCLEYMENHISDASYEEWIRDCHPDNVNRDKIDHRFYVKDSDHRIIWNSYCDMQGHPERKILYTGEREEINTSIM